MGNVASEPVYTLKEVAEFFNAYKSCTKKIRPPGFGKRCKKCVLGKPYKGIIWEVSVTDNPICLALNEFRIGHQAIPINNK
jgi:hypothetical protein